MLPNRPSKMMAACILGIILLLGILLSAPYLFPRPKVTEPTYGRKPSEALGKAPQALESTEASQADIAKTSKEETVVRNPLVSKTVVGSLDHLEVVSPVSVDFAAHDPAMFAHYERLLQKARDSGTQDNVREFVDLTFSYVYNMTLDALDYKEERYVLQLVQKARKDLEGLLANTTEGFSELSRFTLLVSEYMITHHPKKRDAAFLNSAREKFNEVAKRKLDDPVLEREKRYLLFLAQIEGMHRQVNENGVFTNNDYYDYYVLKDVLKLPAIGSSLSARERITVEKINIAAKLEYARRDFVSYSKDLPKGGAGANEDPQVVTSYNQTLAQYTDAVRLLDSLEAQFKDTLEFSDRTYIDMLRRRASLDYKRVPWKYF